MSDKLVNMPFKPLENKHNKEHRYRVGIGIVVGAATVMTFKRCFSYNVIRMSSFYY